MNASKIWHPSQRVGIGHRYGGGGGSVPLLLQIRAGALNAGVAICDGHFMQAAVGLMQEKSADSGKDSEKGDGFHGDYLAGVCCVRSSQSSSNCC